MTFFPKQAQIFFDLQTGQLEPVFAFASDAIFKVTIGAIFIVMGFFVVFAVVLVVVVVVVVVVVIVVVVDLVVVELVVDVVVDVVINVVVDVVVEVVRVRVWLG